MKLLQEVVGGPDKERRAHSSLPQFRLPEMKVNGSLLARHNLVDAGMTDQTSVETPSQVDSISSLERFKVISPGRLEPALPCGHFVRIDAHSGEILVWRLKEVVH